MNDNKSYSKNDEIYWEKSSLCEEIEGLLKKLQPVIQKAHKVNEDLIKFDKLQNKIIKTMGQSEFYTFALQKDMYILQSGLWAENSLESQLGFHQDFFKGSRDN